MKPKALDLFCCAGGASMGLHRAGFDVTGVDIRPQPRYPFRFIQADAMDFPLNGFDLIWASPPCQHYSPMAHARRAQGVQFPDLVAALRRKLDRNALPYIIENVPSAPLEAPAILLCGLSFGLPLLRHRRFESNIGLIAPSHIRHVRGMAIRGEIFTVVGKVTGGNLNANRGSIPYPRASIEQAKRAMGIDWMTLAEICEAVPPAYSEFIGHQAMQQISLVEVAS